MKVGSLFSGIGGIDLGFMQAGFEVAWAIESNHASCETYRANFRGTVLIEQDIRKVNAEDLPPVDVIAAGFPCQAFSVGGKQQGFNDDRGNLFFEIARFICAHNPRFVFLENVANRVQHDNGHTFHVIYNTLIEQGYYIRYRIMRTSEYGNVPQIRDRIYIIAFRSIEDCDLFEFPKPVELQLTAAAIIEKSKAARDHYYYRDESPFSIKAQQIVVDQNTIYRVYHDSIKPIKNGMCPTLTASMGTQKNQVPLVRDDYGVRKLTPRECLRFQGFSDSFGFPATVSLEQRYKQIGNSVSVPVIRSIAKQILASIRFDALVDDIL